VTAPAAAPPTGRRARRATQAPARAYDARLRPPALPVGHLARPRLDAALEAGAQTRLTLVSAHAGSGKTVLLAGWEQRTELPVAWLTVDRDDGASSRFWAALEAALERAGVAPVGRGRAGGEPHLRIVAAAAAVDRPVTVVIDDLHELDADLLGGGFDALLRQAPPQLRLVVATRADPPFPLHRLRLAGELTELRATDLAFTPDEARAVLGAAADRLSERALSTLHERTEGWAAGLRLAALSLERAPDGEELVAAFAGDDRSVADYLVSEVLARQPEERRAFLLATSVASRLPAELATLLSGRADAYELLEQLEAENLFVVREGTSRSVFRYHRLFREFLRAELARSRPDEVPALNELAAAWCHTHDDPLPALEHAVAASSWPLADEIVAECWEELLGAVDPESLRPALQRVPADACRSHGALGLLVGLTLLNAGEPEEGRALAGRALHLLGGAARAGSALAAYGGATLARRRGDVGEAERCAEAVLAEPAAPGAAGLRGAHVRRAVGGVQLGAALVVHGELDVAERALELAHERALDEGLDAIAADAVAQLALVEASRGRLRRSATFARDALALARRRSAETVAADLALAWAHLQWDETDEAAEHAALAATAARRAGDAGGAVAAALLGALVDGTRGAAGADRALRRLRTALGEGGAGAVPHFLAPVLLTADARLLSIRGDLDAALRALEGLDAHDAASRVAWALCRARLELAAGRPGIALETLARARADAESAAPAQAIELCLLGAVAHAEERERMAAAARLDLALELAAVEHYRRVFVEGGPAVQALLVESIRRGTPHRAFVGELLSSFERRAPGVEITKPELLEPLSARERAVLRYLPTLMSNTEIAGELFLSVNTVKTHLRSIYRKLGATRRRDAVERARRLELL
jgi:LuxR family maltose regulon positive regulatory protein